jgi:hypothetical protein
MLRFSYPRGSTSSVHVLVRTLAHDSTNGCLEPPPPARRYVASVDAVAAFASDRNILLSGVLAAAAHGWALPDLDAWPAGPESMVI